MKGVLLLNLGLVGERGFVVEFRPSVSFLEFMAGLLTVPVGGRSLIFTPFVHLRCSHS